MTPVRYLQVSLLAVACFAGCAPLGSTSKANETITQKEINAAAAMDYDGNREGALSVIAARTDLAPADQKHLVNAIYKYMDSDNSKVRLLNQLIKNPAFSNAAKGAMLDGLKRGMKVDINRRQILQQLNDRGPLVEPETTPATTMPSLM